VEECVEWGKILISVTAVGMRVEVFIIRVVLTALEEV
jgi:hypothetical protein